MSPNKLIGVSTQMRNKLPGGALMVSVLLSIIIGVFLAALLLLSHYSSHFISSRNQFAQLICNLENACQIASSNYFHPEQNGLWIKGFNKFDSVRISRKNWGAYLLIAAESKEGKCRVDKAELLGTFLPADTGLLVTDKGRPTNVAGLFESKSTCFLPTGSIKPTNISGQQFLSPEYPLPLKKAPRQIPTLSQKWIEDVCLSARNYDDRNDSISSSESNTITNSFFNKTLIVDRHAMRMDGTYFSGNIKVIGKNLVIDSTCSLNDVMLVCNKVEFRPGFKGTVHVFATDSIVTGARCDFCYPSSFVLISEESQKKAMRFIEIGNFTRFSGAIIAANQDGFKCTPNSILVKMNKDAEAAGYIYSAGSLQLQGKLFGTALADQVIVTSASSTYENHLLSCQIDAAKYKNLLKAPIVFNSRQELLSCKRLR